MQNVLVQVFILIYIIEVNAKVIEHKSSETFVCDEYMRKYVKKSYIADAAIDET